MRILVTGASGRIGRYIMPYLIQDGHNVVALTRGSRHRDILFPEVRHADLRNPGGVLNALRDIDAVIHLAAIASPGCCANTELFENNVVSTYNLLEAASVRGIRRIVFASSIAVLGITYASMFPGRDPVIDRFPINESHRLQPIDSYAISKVVAENICDAFCRRCDMSIVSLRLSWVTFPSDYESIRVHAARRPGYISTLWSYIDARDVAYAVIQSLAANLKGHTPVYVTANDTLSLVPTLELLDEYFPTVPRSTDTLNRHHSVFNCNLAKEVLNYAQQYSWHDSARDPHSAETEGQRYLSGL